VDWDLPATISCGLGYFAERWAVEGDLRWRASLGSRAVVASDEQAFTTFTNHATGAVTTTAVPVAPLESAGPSAVGGALGGRIILSHRLSMHAGVWYDPSPVSNADDDLFTPMDIWGASLGATYRGDEKTTFSLGLLGTYGTAEGVQVFPDPADPTGGKASVIGLQGAFTTSFSL
jgi:long-subunit fatty acid transport protein